MSYLNTNIFSKNIDRYGELVSLEVYSSESYSDYGDLMSQTTTIYDVRAIFNTYGVQQNFEQEGQFGSVHYSFFFKGSQVGVEVDNFIEQADGTRWKINRVDNHKIEGNNVVREAKVVNG